MQGVSEVEVGGNPRVGRSMSTNPHLTSLCIPVHPIMSVSMYGQAFSRAKNWVKVAFNGPKMAQKGNLMSTNPHLASLCIPLHPIIMSGSMYGQAFSTPPP